MYGIWATDKSAYDKGEPFEIPMMGLGLFSCRTAAWPGFNENFRGFGAEEGYIHEKIRRLGGKCICLPSLRWNHRFQRPAGAPYPNVVEDRIWNYFVGWLEILKTPNHPFIENIVKAFSDRVPESVVRSILEKAKTTMQ
jgi:predicted glycosyltransferase involved in capsule biosynthesis